MTADITAQAKEAGQRRVLIAEDDRGIAEALALIVTEVGRVPEVAYDGRQALSLARRAPPDLVITDLRMPHMDGTALIASLRADALAQGRSAPPIVLMTALRALPDRAIVADAILFKPFSMTEVIQLLERFLPGTP